MATMKTAADYGEAEKGYIPAPTIDEIRKNSKINIILPMQDRSDDEIDDYEFVTVNGKTTQIKRGEAVAVNITVYEALINSGKFDKSILV